MNILIKPIYGWGWFDEKGSIEVPGPITTDIVEVIEAGAPFKYAICFISEVEHPLSETWLALSQRTATSDGGYNLRAFNKKPLPYEAWLPKAECLLLSGYAYVISA